jgi:HTH-type transcriptional regulator/antitoxin HipB
MTRSQINSIRAFAATVRGRRQDLGLSQGELAGRARVSRQWVNEFESGKPGAEMQLILRLLDALDLRLLVEGDARSAADRPRPSTADDLDSLIEEHRRP